MKSILIQGGLWLIKQRWFQFELVKLLTQIVEKAEVAADKTENEVDDKVVAFVKRNQGAILSIAQIEQDKDDTPIDNILLTALTKLK